MEKRGGKREGAGRKTKAEELKIFEAGKNAIEQAYGSLENYWNHIANESKNSFPHLKMLQEYMYGKPKESKDITTNGESINFTKIQFFEPED